jgi:hypothetical protein
MPFGTSQPREEFLRLAGTLKEDQIVPEFGVGVARVILSFAGGDTSQNPNSNPSRLACTVLCGCVQSTCHSRNADCRQVRHPD